MVWIPGTAWDNGRSRKGFQAGNFRIPLLLSAVQDFEATIDA
jgi:hypothetical protein